MPGSSLWLLPPRGHALEGKLEGAIREVGRRFGSGHLFAPHVTLTSGVEGEIYAADPQAWLDALPFPPAANVHVRLASLASDPVFVRKLYARVDKDGVRALGRVARKPVEAQAGSVEERLPAEAWVEEKWTPHLSLLYHDCPVVGEEKIKEVEGLLREMGVGEEGEKGWDGGRVWLVDTSKPIGEWVPVAERVL